MAIAAPTLTPVQSLVRDRFAWLLGPAVFLSRWLLMSRPYFADGPKLIEAARNRTYVIQPPGYWLYTHIGALFADPGFGFSLVNALFSGAGAVVFYAVCLQLRERQIARFAAAAYASIYFAWFAGCTQSSYAGELLFGPLLLLFMLRYRARPSTANLAGISISYAVAAGLRPSDGAFLAPAMLAFLWRYVPEWKSRLLALCSMASLCLAWFLPEQSGLHSEGISYGDQLLGVARTASPLLNGFSKPAISNLVRTVVPLLIAFWSVLPAIFSKRDSWVRGVLWLWIAPGLAFFALIYISDATYLCYLVSAVLLLAVTGSPARRLSAALVLCCLSNLLFFSFARPVEQTRSLPVAIYSVSGARYCAWALKHQWFRTLRTYTDASAVANPPAH